MKETHIGENWNMPAIGDGRTDRSLQRGSPEDGGHSSQDIVSSGKVVAGMHFDGCTSSMVATNSYFSTPAKDWQM